MLPLSRNPLIYRHWCVTFRPARFWTTLVIVLGLLGLALLYIILVKTFGRRGWSDYDGVEPDSDLYMLSASAAWRF